MASPFSITALGLAWTLGVLVVVRPRPAEQATEHIKVTQPAADAATLAEAILESAQSLQSLQVGGSGAFSAVGLAWNTLIQSEERSAAFRRLARSHNPVAQFYALIRLHSGKDAEYERLADVLRAMGGTIPVIVGCVAMNIETDALIEWISKGQWRKFLSWPTEGRYAMPLDLSASPGQ